MPPRHNTQQGRPAGDSTLNQKPDFYGDWQELPKGVVAHYQSEGQKKNIDLEWSPSNVHYEIIVKWPNSDIKGVSSVVIKYANGTEKQFSGERLSRDKLSVLEWMSALKSLANKKVSSIELMLSNDAKVVIEAA